MGATDSERTDEGSIEVSYTVQALSLGKNSFCMCKEWLNDSPRNRALSKVGSRSGGRGAFQGKVIASPE